MIYLQKKHFISIPPGPIKRKSIAINVSAKFKFQFHLVRLKVDEVRKCPFIFSEFQFHLVRLKARSIYKK